MSKAATVAAVVALGLSGYAVWRTSSPAPGATPAAPPASDESLAARIDALERRVAALADAPPLAAPSPGAAPTLGASPAAGAAGGAHAGASPAAGPGSETDRTSATRLEDVEKRLAAVEEARKKEAAESPFGRGRAVFGGRPGGFLLTTEDAQRELELTDGQKAEWDRIVADARREQDALRKIPDDEGRTWDQHQREMIADLMSSAGGGGAKLDLGKMAAFRNKQVPGRSETFGQADQRIRDDARRQMRNTLTTAQADRFDKTNVDPMLGGGGNAIATTFAVPATPGR
jgi:hypothetical protein